MTLKGFCRTVFFNLICALGSTLALLGLIFSCWFFLASDHAYRFYLGFGFLLIACIGYSIYRFAFPKISKKWTDNY